MLSVDFPHQVGSSAVGVVHLRVAVLRSGLLHSSGGAGV